MYTFHIFCDWCQLVKIWIRCSHSVVQRLLNGQHFYDFYKKNCLNSCLVCCEIFSDLNFCLLLHRNRYPSDFTLVSYQSASVELKSISKIDVLVNICILLISISSERNNKYRVNVSVILKHSD